MLGKCSAGMLGSHGDAPWLEEPATEAPLLARCRGNARLCDISVELWEVANASPARSDCRLLAMPNAQPASRSSTEGFATPAADTGVLVEIHNAGCAPHDVEVGAVRCVVVTLPHVMGT